MHPQKDTRSALHRLLTRAFGLLAGLRGMDVQGLERVPRDGPVIVAANHVSLFDPPVTHVAVSRVRYARYLGKEELFRIPPLGALLKNCGVIPLDRGRGDMAALRVSLGVLSGGGCLVVYPEGTRSRDGRPGRPKAGVGLLAKRTGAVVVPVRLRNTERFWMRGPWSVRFGTPLRYEEGEDRGGAQRFAERVMDEVWKL
ncbi:MAG: lysophospholipid acyltransferase family protein [Elusimicrobiota bacterium]